MQDLNKLTVAELRSEIKTRHENGELPTGWSKLRKSELMNILTDLRSRENTAVAVVDDMSVTDEALQDFVGAAMSAASGIDKVRGAIQVLGTILHEQAEAFTAAEREQLNEAKYRGRYEGKPAVVQIRKHVVEGTVTDRVHRGTELLLVLRHAEDAGHPRVTLHKAVDVLV